MFGEFVTDWGSIFMPVTTDNRGDHMDFHYLQRVKVYRLSEEGKWDDKGTGHVCVEYLERSDVVGLVVIDEEDNETLLVHHISADDIYRRQEDTIIAWRDPEMATELALSFQEAMGCSFIWDQICNVQRSIHLPNVGAVDGSSRPINNDMERSRTSQANDDTFQEASSFEVRELPQVELSTLPLILKTVTEGHVLNHIRIAELIVQDQTFLSKLLELFKMCEDVENIEGLHLIFKIMKGIISLNSAQIFEMIFSDEYIMDVVGTLEYDPELPSRREHRAFLREQVIFKQAMPIGNSSILSKIHQTYRVGYIKDVILPRVLDEVTFTTINSIIHSNNATVMSELKEDGAFMHEMFVRLKSPDIPNQTKKDLVLFLQEFCNLSRSLQLVHQMRLVRNLVTEGLFEVTTDALQSPDKSLRLAGTDILIVVLNQDPSLLRTFLVQQEGHALLSLLVKGISTSFGGDICCQFLEIIRMVLDPYATSGAQKDMLVDIFYDKYMDQLIDVITSACPANGSTYLDRKSTCLDGSSTGACLTVPEILSNICDLLCFCVLHHSHRIKYYFLNNDVIEKVLRLTRRKEKYLVVAGIRFLRTIISRNDDSLHCHIVKNDLFDPVIQAFRANGNRYNLINSAVLELIEYIRKENFKSLISYVVENYSHDLEKIDYVDSFQQLKLKYEQSLEGYPPQGVTGGGKDHGEHRPNHFSQITAITEPMKQNDDRVLKKEEDCFTEDSVDEDNLVAARTSASCNQLASANVGNGSVLDSSVVRGQSIGLVDYEHDDDNPTSVSTTSGGPEFENSEILYSSLPANDSVRHEAVDSPKEKRMLTIPDSTSHGPEALKKQRLHTNSQDHSVATDVRDEVQKLTVKEKQGSLSCNPECGFQEMKEVDVSAREERYIKEGDSLALQNNLNGNESRKIETGNGSEKDTNSSTSKEGFEPNRSNYEIGELNFVKDELNEDKPDNASNELIRGGPHLIARDSVQ